MEKQLHHPERIEKILQGGKTSDFFGGGEKIGKFGKVKYNPRWNLLGYFFWQFCLRGFYHGA